MNDHPMVWCRNVDRGRAWYTALGHEIHMYLLPDFQQHLLAGIQTAAGWLPADCGPREDGALAVPGEGPAFPP